MTDNEIIKALDEHYIKTDMAYCDHLAQGGPSDEHEEMYIHLLAAVLDLINRQKEKIERLEHLIVNKNRLIYILDRQAYKMEDENNGKCKNV